MVGKEKKQWDILKKTRDFIMNWAKENCINIHIIHFIPMIDFSLEIYVFYKNNSDLAKNKTTGISDEVKKIFLKTLLEVDYIKSFGNNIVFIFDSDENVIKNYEGSYFLRLR